MSRFVFFFFLVFVPAFRILPQSFLGQKQTIPLRHGKWTNLCVCSSIPLFLATSMSRNSVWMPQSTSAEQETISTPRWIQASRNIQDEPGLLGLSPVQLLGGLGQWGISGITMCLWVFMAKITGIINSCGY